MIVHFICKGNAYRSRLAEAYFNSKKLSNFRAISSGVEEEKHKEENGPISWAAERILQNNSLISYMSNFSKQTTKNLLNKSDFIVFMSQEYLNYCKQKLTYKSTDYDVWEIKDFGGFGITAGYKSREQELKKIEISEKTFEEIKDRIDKLIQKINKNSGQS